MEDKIEVKSWYDLGPFAFLEGGQGLNELEEDFMKYLFDKRVNVYKLDRLYDQPRKIGALQFLDCKTLVLGTTGVYKEELNKLKEIFFKIEFKGIENIILTLGCEDVLWRDMLKFHELYPNVKFMSLMDDYEGSFELYEIKLKN